MSPQGPVIVPGGWHRFIPRALDLTAHVFSNTLPREHNAHVAHAAYFLYFWMLINQNGPANVTKATNST